MTLTAKTELNRLSRARVPRSRRLELAMQCRELGLHHASIRFLSPIEDPTDLERAELAAALINLGAVRSGRALIERIDGKTHARVWWLRAFSLIREWNWTDAIPFYEAYRGSPGIDEVERLRGQIYLATALIHGPARYDEARAMLEPLVARQQRGLPAQVSQTARLIEAQSYVLERRARLAKLTLERLSEQAAVEPLPPLQAVMARQWMALACKDRQRLLGPIRRDFERIGAWEWARSCVVFTGEFCGDHKLLRQAWFGSPYRALRARIESRIGEIGQNDSFDWPNAKKGAIVLDVASGHAHNRGWLRSNGLPHRILTALCSDLYRPLSIVELHELVYPGEHYLGEASADRVHKGIKRLRQWFEQHGLEIEVRSRQGGFQIVAARPVVLRLTTSSEQTMKPALLSWVNQILASRHGLPISVGLAARACAISRRSAQRRLADAVASGLLERSGFGPATRYQLSQRAMMQRKPV